MIKKRAEGKKAMVVLEQADEEKDEENALSITDSKQVEDQSVDIMLLNAPDKVSTNKVFTNKVFTNKVFTNKIDAIELQDVNREANKRNVIIEDKVYTKAKFSSERYKGKKRTSGDNIILTLIFFLEATSCLDYLGDILVLRQLFGKHPAWATLSIYFMISPFYVSYIPLINF
jgi:hypothetical protein